MTVSYQDKMKDVEEGLINENLLEGETLVTAKEFVASVPDVVPEGKQFMLLIELRIHDYVPYVPKEVK